MHRTSKKGKIEDDKKECGENLEQGVLLVTEELSLVFLQFQFQSSCSLRSYNRGDLHYIVNPNASSGGSN